ncbi:MAG: hypothetical protein J6Q81_00255, partial [Lentisphaeria bacterium]|nr:hypothetical protein [Lentisphaeria bacterium]
LAILRPLLKWQKADLEEFLIQHNITDWRHDSTNSESVYHRNFLRNKILNQWSEYYPPLADGMAISAEILAMDSDFIEQSAAEKLAELGEALPLKTSADYWKNMHEALLSRVLRSYLAKISKKNDTTLSFAGLEQFKQALNLPESCEKRIIEINKFFRFQLTGKTLKLLLPETEITPDSPQVWNWRQTPQIQYGKWFLTGKILPGAVTCEEQGVFYFDADSMPEVLELALRKGGETMHVWGSEAPRRVKHLLCGAENKENMLLVTGAGIIYLLGDLRRSIHAPVTEKTSNTLEIRIFREN